jgi:hypothetical protein
VPALRKGQYSVSGCNGSFAFKRRYTDANTDSYALVCISGGATFSNIPNGKYTDCVTGDVKNVTNGTLTASCSGKGNLRVYVLSTDKTPAPGKIGDDGKYIYTSSAKNIPDPTWDGTEMELTDEPEHPGGGGQGGGETQVIEPCLTDANERAVFFTKSSDFSNNIHCYIWHTGTGSVVNVCGAWPGMKATSLGNGKYKFVIPESAKAIDNTWQIIWNEGSSSCQTRDLAFKNHYMYAGADKQSVNYTTEITTICPNTEAIDEVTDTKKVARKMILNGQLYIYRNGKWYTPAGQLITTDASGILPER